MASENTPAAHITITLDSEGLHLKADGDQATITALLAVEIAALAENMGASWQALTGAVIAHIEDHLDGTSQLLAETDA